jgi:hypothetical protein
VIKTRIRWVAHVGEMMNAYKILVKKSEEKRPFGRLRHGWDSNIKTDLNKIM